MINKGGRGKKAPYTTVVMRIPNPIKSEVQQLLHDFHEKQKPKTSLERLPASFVADWEPQRKQEARSAFREWHCQALNTLGREKLEALYQTCYKVDWGVIESILYNFNGDWWEVLGISPDSSLADAKKAFRKLAKVHHPDAGGDIERMRSLNRAMEKAEQAFEPGKYRVNKQY